MSAPADGPSPLVPPVLPPGAGPDRVLPPLEPGTHPAPPPDPPHVAPTASMGGPLVISPPGATVIATDGMRAAVDRAHALAAHLDHAVRTVHRAELVPGALPMPHLGSLLRGASSAADRLADAIDAASHRYAAAEHRAGSAFDALASVGGALLGGTLGAVGRMAGVAAGLQVLGGGVVGLGILATEGAALKRASSGVGTGVGRLLVQHPQLLSNPRFVAAVRGVADGLDEGMGTAVGLPPAVAVALGATGATGVRTSAGALMHGGPAAGLLKESPVDVQRVDRQAVTAPPVGAAQRLTRVPEGNQVRIERYSAAGRDDRYVVYVGPTETFDPGPKGEPWDLASNVGGVGGEDVGSIRATELAMTDAGIRPGSEVQLVGFSQGGMVAARIAADGNWNAVGLQTFGAPVGNVALPDGMHGMQVRNAEDFIPALAGPQTDAHLLQVERTVYADPSQMPTDQAAPGHQRVAYAATADAIDAARSRDVREQSAALDAFTGDYAAQDGSSITAFSYHATRRDGSG
ncbi:hypothetical protein [Pseudolysinimonas sp.]|uniref:hypothetical protein n=1 Tax=Pseudolysinimonas sp. TaxID=2680009 RepID=UPI003F7DD0AE